MIPHPISTLHLLWVEETYKSVSGSHVVLPQMIHPQKGSLEGEGNV